MQKQLDAGVLVDPDKELELDFHGAELTTVRSEPRLVRHSHVGLHTGTAIFDEKMLVDRFNDEIRPLKGTEEFERGTHSATMAARAVDIIGSAMIADRAVVVGEFADESRWISGFFLADSETYVASIEGMAVQQRPFYWFDDVRIKRVGFAPMYDLIEDFHESGRVDTSSKPARDYALAFGLTDAEVSVAVGRVAQTGCDFLTAAVDQIRKRDVVPQGFDMPEDLWVHARLLTENRMLVRYGLGETASLHYAERMWETWQLRNQARSPAAQVIA